MSLLTFSLGLDPVTTAAHERHWDGGCNGALTRRYVRPFEPSRASLEVRNRDAPTKNNKRISALADMIGSDDSSSLRKKITALNFEGFALA